MKTKINHILLFLVLFSFQLTLNAQEKKITQEEYIGIYKEIAVREMIRNKIPSSITLAQGILETGNGNSLLATEANNHFGIKCHLVWEGKVYYYDDDEKDECFRKYKHANESFKDHSDFLISRSRYSNLFKLSQTDYKGWAHGLRKAGYATNPQYAIKLISIIERHKLYKLDEATMKYVAKRLKSLKNKSKNDSLNTKKQFNHIKSTDLTSITRVYIGRKLFLRNKIKCTMAINNDSPTQIARDFNMFVWQIAKYNDIDKNTLIPKDAIIYLAPKRRKNKTDFHISKKGETIHTISQYYSIKLKNLLKFNNIKKNDLLKEGQKILLHK